MRWSPFSSAVAVALVLGAASAAPAQLRLERVVRADGPTVGFVEDPVAPGTFLLVGQDGLVRVVAPEGVRETPFLDLRGVISSGGERGLLGLAFPPDAAASGRVFVNFTNPEGHTVIARFTRRGDDPHAVDPGSRRDLRVARRPRLHRAAIRQPQRRPPRLRPRRLSLRRDSATAAAATIPAIAPSR